MFIPVCASDVSRLELKSFLNLGLGKNPKAISLLLRSCPLPNTWKVQQNRKLKLSVNSQLTVLFSRDL